MLRFPNPGSTIQNFVRIYAEVFTKLGNRISTLDEITSVVVAANLATSSGYIGDEAIARSTRADRSRDPLYNQHKMYAELFRWLGWLHPTETSALNYTCTLLGQQVAAARNDFAALLDECVLGILCPNPIISPKGSYDLRPFAFILRVMAECDGHLARDEMIAGPLSAPTDRGRTSLQEVAAVVRSMRLSADASAQAVEEVSTAREIQVNTLQNYTRWPIALLRDLGWATSGSARFKNGKSYRTFHLTEKGWALARRVESSVDLRVDHIGKIPPTERAALAIVAHYRMLERSGFVVEPMNARISEAEATAASTLSSLKSDGRNLLFSPFQSLTTKNLSDVFATQARAAKGPEASIDLQTTEKQDGRDDRSHLFVHPNLVSSKEAGLGGPDELRRELRALLLRHSQIETAAAEFAAIHARDTQTAFYPLVTHLFQILGFESDYSRAGVNYQRWDAYVMSDGYALPVEIKSPTEELVLSTKAVRQALENKVVLLSRGGLATRPELASLVVGNRLPNERAEMSNLIDDVFKAFGFCLGVIDLTTLSHLALRATRDGVTVDPVQLSRLRGFLNV